MEVVIRLSLEFDWEQSIAQAGAAVADSEQSLEASAPSSVETSTEEGTASFEAFGKGSFLACRSTLVEQTATYTD